MIRATQLRPRLHGEQVPVAPAGAPVHVIEAGRASLLSDLRELWAHRDLLYFLTLRDVKLRYKQTVLGALWAILQPFLTMVVFTVLFGRLAKVPSDGLPYPIFAYAGLVPWQFFQNAVNQGGNSLVGNAQLITKVYFPRMVIPGAAVLAALVDFAVASLILFAMMAFYGIAPGARVVLYPVLIALLAAAASAAGMWMAALNVRYRDVKYVLPFTLQLGMFLTPVIYPVTFVPANWRWLLMLNPLTGIVGGFRSALLGRPFDWIALGVGAALTLAALALAAWVFRRMERSFADVI